MLNCSASPEPNAERLDKLIQLKSTVDETRITDLKRIITTLYNLNVDSGARLERLQERTERFYVYAEEADIACGNSLLED